MALWTRLSILFKMAATLGTDFDVGGGRLTRRRGLKAQLVLFRPIETEERQRAMWVERNFQVGGA